MRQVVYYNLIDHPVTALEIWRWVGVLARYGEIRTTLDQLVASGQLEERHGWYYLVGRRPLIERRHESYYCSYRKLRRARRVARLLAHLPWIRSIAIYNSVAIGAADRQSDLDVALITAQGRAWSARFWVLSVLKLLRLRPRRSHKSDMICVSIVMAQDDLNLEPTMQSWPCAMPSFGPGQYMFLVGTGADFFTSNSWLTGRAPQWYSARLSSRWQGPMRRSVVRFAAESLGALVPERYYRQWQERAMPRLGAGERVDGTNRVITDSMIKLHSTLGADAFRRRLTDQLHAHHLVS